MLCCLNIPESSENYGGGGDLIINVHHFSGAQKSQNVHTNLRLIFIHLSPLLGKLAWLNWRGKADHGPTNLLSFTPGSCVDYSRNLCQLAPALLAGTKVTQFLKHVPHDKFIAFYSSGLQC